MQNIIKKDNGCLNIFKTVGSLLKNVKQLNQN